MKRIISFILVLTFVFAFVSCSSTSEHTTSKVKVGLICLHDSKSTYDLNFINALYTAQKTLGLSDSQILIKTNIPEGSECLEAIDDLVDQGCNIIFADSFGHEDYVITGAQKYPNVQFFHATGTKAHTEGLTNYHNAFAAIYQGRYLSGVAAGLKLNEMIASGAITEDQAVMGYVGAFLYAEVISGYTSFYLGAKSVCPSVTMKVQFTGSWYDETAEKNAALSLIQSGCVLISQHADSLGAPSACEDMKVPNISYNGSTESTGPNSYIVSSKINWAPFFEYIIKAVENGETIPYDTVGTFADGSIEMTEINDVVAAAGTAEKLAEVLAALKDGTTKVFDTSTFTVNGEHLTSYMADVNSDANYEGDTEAIIDGEFKESTYRSAPYFFILIDGITLVN